MNDVEMDKELLRAAIDRQKELQGFESKLTWRARLRPMVWGAVGVLAMGIVFGGLFAAWHLYNDHLQLHAAIAWINQVIQAQQKAQGK